ncbi:hypothetical protein JT358_11530 [Micrococcales bacterium 31B]|nr:hypothetical protein [Micrococcales bacterium 31B]
MTEELIIGIVGPLVAAIATIATARITSRGRVDAATERAAEQRAAEIADLESRIEALRRESREARANLRRANVVIDTGREYIVELRLLLVRESIRPPEWPELLRRLM